MPPSAMDVVALVIAPSTGVEKVRKACVRAASSAARRYPVNTFSSFARANGANACRLSTRHTWDEGGFFLRAFYRRRRHMYVVLHVCLFVYESMMSLDDVQRAALDDGVS